LARTKSIESLKRKKAELNQEIMDLRMRKAEINKTLDLIYNKKSVDPSINPLKLVNELYGININISNLRDKVDDINKNLQIRQVTGVTWAT
jgi:uncharacterized coiled-coil DUF342 family protein